MAAGGSERRRKSADDLAFVGGSACETRDYLESWLRWPGPPF
jgi:hypothetical protein